MNDPGLLNYRWAYVFADTLASLGVRHACISPGSRSTPLTLAFTHHPGITCFSHVDERSSAYFALGLSKVSRIPTVLICTSGTAGANYYPAIIEASYSHVPLIICTADRPQELQGTGANQTINQQELYGSASRWFADAGLPAEPVSVVRELGIKAFKILRQDPPGPVHLNFPFRKPLEPESQSKMVAFRSSYQSGKTDVVSISNIPFDFSDSGDFRHLLTQVNSAMNGLIIAGPMEYDPAQKPSILELAEALKFPVLADGLSQLRCRSTGNTYLCEYAPLFLSANEFTRTASPDIILRFGSMPTSNAAHEFLRDNDGVPQFLLGPPPVTDATHTLDFHVQGTIQEICRKTLASLPHFGKPHTAFADLYIRANEITRAVLKDHFSQSKGLSELQIFPELLPLLPEQTNLMVSNSMPVRDADLYGPVTSNEYQIFFNRGASGIDGITSTAFGIAAGSGQPTVLVTGDLAFYHDLNGLLAWKRYNIPLTIILINNNGGAIFEKLPLRGLADGSFEEYFLTPHEIDFRPIVEGYNGRFTVVESKEAFSGAVSDAIVAGNLNIIEVRTHRTGSMKSRQALHGAVRSSLSDFLTSG